MGRDYLDQIKHFIGLLGTPTEEDIEFVQVNSPARKFLAKVPHANKVDWQVRYPEATADSLASLDTMLQLNPTKRSTALQAMRHKCFDHMFDDELDSVVECPKLVDWRLSEL